MIVSGLFLNKTIRATVTDLMTDSVIGGLFGYIKTSRIKYIFDVVTIE